MSYRNTTQQEAVEPAGDDHLPAINNENENKPAPETNNELESQQRKNRKRLQLKNLIITKFRNKYDASASNEDDVNMMIQNEVDDLFERD